MSLRPCPCCKNINYMYGWDSFKSVVDLFKPSRYALSGAIGSISTTAILNIASNFAFAFKYPFNPLLFCKSCGSYSVQCPECKEFLYISKEYPKIKATYNCSDCTTEFRLCAKTSEFDQDIVSQK